MTGDSATEVAKLCLAGEYERAVNVGEQRVVEQPDDLALRLRMATTYGGLERFDDAYRHLDEAESVSDGQNATVFYERARLDSFGGRTSAREAAQRSIEVDPMQSQLMYFFAEHPWQGDYIVMPGMRLIYSPIPKSGSTSIKSALLNFVDEEQRKGPQGKGPHRTFNGERVRQDRLRVRDLPNEYYRFAVVRDDLERFESYYKRNVVEAESLQRAAKGRSEHFGLPTIPTIDELATDLAKYQYLFLDVAHHTLPTRAYLHSDPSFYDDVFELSQMAELEQRLFAHTAEHISLPHELKSSGPDSGARLSDDAHAALVRYYEPNRS